VAELSVPRQRACSNDFIARSREVAKQVWLSDILRAFAPSRDTNSGPFILSAFGG